MRKRHTCKWREFFTFKAHLNQGMLSFQYPPLYIIIALFTLPGVGPLHFISPLPSHLCPLCCCNMWPSNTATTDTLRWRRSHITPFSIHLKTVYGNKVVRHSSPHAAHGRRASQRSHITRFQNGVQRTRLQLQ